MSLTRAGHDVLVLMVMVMIMHVCFLSWERKNCHWWSQSLPTQTLTEAQYHCGPYVALYPHQPALLHAMLQSRWQNCIQALSVVLRSGHGDDVPELL